MVPVFPLLSFMTEEGPLSPVACVSFSIKASYEALVKSKANIGVRAGYVWAEQILLS